MNTCSDTQLHGRVRDCVRETSTSASGWIVYGLIPPNSSLLDLECGAGAPIASDPWRSFLLRSERETCPRGTMAWPLPANTTRDRYAAIGIHHTALPAAQRHGEACHSHVEGAARVSASLRNTAARDAHDWRMAPVLEPPSPPSGAGHEDPRRGICFSGLTSTGSAWLLHTLKRWP